MSESSDILKYTQTAEYRQRIAQEKLKFREEELECALMRDRHKNFCSHYYKSGSPAINLQHNFPDGCPRGICSLCFTVIHPVQWSDAGPNQLKRVNAHPFYPIVEAMETRDHALAVLDDAHSAAIDAAFYYCRNLGVRTTLADDGLLSQVDQIFGYARVQVQDTFSSQAAMYYLVRKGS